MIAGPGHLQEVLARLAALGVRDVFAIAGDVEEPAGEFVGALDLLRAMASLGHDLDDVGVTGHPEPPVHRRRRHHPGNVGQAALRHLHRQPLLRRVEGVFAVLMCIDCLATRGHGTGPYPAMTRAEMRASLNLLPTWVLEQGGRLLCTSVRADQSAWLTARPSRRE